MATWVPDDRDDLDVLARDLAALFAQAEARLRRELALQLAVGFDAGVAIDRAIQLGQLRLTAEQVAAWLRTAHSEQIDRIIATASQAGTAAALSEMTGLAATRPLVSTSGSAGALAAMLLRSDLTSVMDDLTARILRWPDDVYRQAVAMAASDVVLGLASSRSAQARAWQGLVNRGVGGFVDRSGRRWNLATYVEMATRTATRRAWDEQHTATMAANGLDLVSVIVGSGACRACSDVAGKVLSTGAGPTGRVQVPSTIGPGDVTVTVHTTIDRARGDGWRHPNCRCRVVAYLPGLSVPADQTTYDPEMEQARTKLRDLEVRVRRAAAQERAAVSPERATAARRVRLDLQAQIREHTAQTGLLRRRHREQPNLGRVSIPGMPAVP